MKIKPLNILFNMFVIFTVAVVVFVGVNIFSGADGYVVMTDSMAPTLNRGDIVFVKETNLESLSEGDIVTVEFPDGSGHFTHKIVSIDYISGTVRTKGDANENEDPQPSMIEQIVGEMWYSVPLFGYISIALGEVDMIKVSVVLAVILIVMIAASIIISNLRKRGD